MLSFLGNLVWFVCGGLFMSVGWFIAGCLMALSIIGLPWARSAFVIAQFTFRPFGRALVKRDQLTGKSDIGTSGLGFIGNVIWFIVAGWWLAIGHLIAGLTCAVTIIGIPWGWQHLKIAAAAVAPIGLKVAPIQSGHR